MTFTQSNIKIYKGNIIFTPTLEEFKTVENGYIVVENNLIKDIYKNLPKEYSSFNIVDYTDKLIIPGFVDLHFHAPQFPNRGLGLDKELLGWLETYTFPEEAKYHDMNYAKKVYKNVIKELYKHGTTRSVIFSSIHKNSTKLLLDLFIKSGLGAFVGKVNMDRNSTPSLAEDTKESLNETEEILKEYMDKSDLVKPIITPRFLPTCSDELLKGLNLLSNKYNANIQSHISENKEEVDWVKELYPDFKNYARAYDSFSMFGQQPTVMAHCVYNTDDEIDLMTKNNVYAAHCPNANFNLSSGIMPVRKFLDKNVKVGLGTDIGAGHKVSIKDVMKAAIQSSKMKWLESNKKLCPLKTSEAFYLGTKGGGNFFGNVGSFEKDYEFDALVIDDNNLGDTNITVKERLERFIYIGDDRNIIERYVSGNNIKEPIF